MYLIAAFLLGIANFAMHKAVVEFGILLGAMLFAYSGSTLVLGLYAAYTAFNAIAAWLLLSRRL
jgi:hypothetical protein